LDTKFPLDIIIQNYTFKQEKNSYGSSCFQFTAAQWIINNIECEFLVGLTETKSKTMQKKKSEISHCFSTCKLKAFYLVVAPVVPYQSRPLFN